MIKLFDIFNKNDDDAPEFARKNDFNDLQRLVETHQEFLNNIYVFHELKPTHYMELMRSISFELFYFFDYVCKKHDIDYWLDYGTLLGAVRHNDFIPWDDDLDVGMMRSDYFRFIDVIQDEIDESGIIDVVAVFKHDVRNREHLRFFQIEFRRPEFNGKFIGIDIFPYDYIANPENVKEKFTEARSNFYQRRIDGMDIKEVVAELYDDLDLSMEKQDYIIAGVEVPRGPGEMYPFKVIETDKLLPFSEVEFGGKTYNAPNDIKKHLKQIYGKRFMRIPDAIHDHRRLNRYVKQKNIITMLEESNEMIINVTRNLK